MRYNQPKINKDYSFNLCHPRNKQSVLKNNFYFFKNKNKSFKETKQNKINVF